MATTSGSLGSRSPQTGPGGTYSITWTISGLGQPRGDYSNFQVTTSDGKSASANATTLTTIGHNPGQTVTGNGQAYTSGWFAAGSGQVFVPADPPLPGSTSVSVSKSATYAPANISWSWTSVPNATSYVYSGPVSGEISGTGPVTYFNAPAGTYSMSVTTKGVSGSGPTSSASITLSNQPVDTVAPTVNSFTVTSRTQTSITVSASATDSGNPTSGMDQLAFYMSAGYSYVANQTPTVYQGKVVGGSGSWTYSGLTASTYYSIGVYALDIAGNISNQTIIHDVLTSAPPPPGAPSGLTGNPLTAKNIDLNWTASSGGVSGYRVWVYSSANATWNDYGTTTNTYKQIQPTLEFTNYPIYVEAYGPGGTSGHSNQITVRTSESNPPVINSGDFLVSSKTTSSITLQGRATDSQAGMSQIQFKISGGSPNPPSTTVTNFMNPAFNVGNNTFVSNTATGLTAGYYYTVGMVALDVWSNMSSEAQITNVRIPIPASPPSSVYGRSSANNDKLIVVQWNMGANATSVDIYYSLDGGAFTYHSNSNFTTLTVGGNAFYEVYVPSYGNYVVRFYGRNSDLGQSSGFTDTASISIVDFIPPGDPAISFLSSTPGSIAVRASGGNTDVGSGWAGYQFYISVPPNTSTAGVDGPIQTGTDHTFSGLLGNTAYLVGVRSKDVSGNQSAFAGITVTTPSGRPDDFAWDTAKVSGQNCVISANEWNRLMATINLFRTYTQLATIAWGGTVGVGNSVYADAGSFAYNDLRSAINAIPGKTQTLGPIHSAGDAISAADLDKLRTSLNSTP